MTEYFIKNYENYKPKCSACGKELFNAGADVRWCRNKDCSDYVLKSKDDKPYQSVAGVITEVITENDWIDEERRFLKKCTMVYEQYLEETNPNYAEAKDGIVDAILTHWTASDDGWQNAKNVVKKWLKPTLKMLREKKNEK